MSTTVPLDQPIHKLDVCRPLTFGGKFMKCHMGSGIGVLAQGHGKKRRKKGSN